MKPSNKYLQKAKTCPNDEYYTLYEDVEAELSHYAADFKGKRVFLPCDDPRWSSFWLYLHHNYERLGLAGLMSAHISQDGRPSFSMAYYGGNDADATAGVVRPFKGDGDFRSAESLALLRECDLVCTNPPFSLFREFIGLLYDYKKKFLIVGNKNAVTYNVVFPRFRDNQLWLGFTRPGFFNSPEGRTRRLFGMTRWFTNLESAREKPLLFTEDSDYPAFDPALYPVYEDVAAREVSRVCDIPRDYYGLLGVPCTFMDVYNPDEWELLGVAGNSSTMSEELQKAAPGRKRAILNGQVKYKRVFIRRRAGESAAGCTA